MTEAILVGAIASMLYEMVAHWFPYQRFTGGRRDLPKVANYVIGCIGVLLGLLVWGVLARDRVAPIEAVGVAVLMFALSGAAVVGAYAIDKVAELWCYQQGRQAMDDAAVSVTEEE